MEQELASLQRQLNGEPEPKTESGVTPVPGSALPTPGGQQPPTAPASNGEVLRAVTDAAAGTGNWGAADPYIDRALRSNPFDPAANTAAAQSSLAKGDFAGARDSASQALKADPDNSGALGVRAVANNALGDKPAALKDANSVLKLSPEDKTAKSLVNMLAPKDVSHDVGRFKGAGFGPDKEAGALGGSAAGGVPGGPAGADRPARGAPPAALTGPRDLGKAASLTQEAAVRLRLGDHAGAARAASAAIASGDDGSAPLILRGKARDAEGRHEEAAADETAALEKEMDAALNALMERAWSQARLGKTEAARADARAAEHLAADGSAEDDLARGLLARPEAAGQPGGPAAPGLPAVPSLYSGISPRSLAAARQARERLAVGDIRDALSLCAQALSWDGGNHLAYIVRAAAYRLQGRYDEAVLAATEALRLQPRAAEALLARSLAYLHLKDWARAEADASAAVAFAPGRIEAYRQRLLARRMLRDEAGCAADELKIAELEKAGRPLGGASRAHPWAVAAGLGAVLLGLAVWRLRQFRRPPEPPTCEGGA